MSIAQIPVPYRRLVLGEGYQATRTVGVVAYGADIEDALGIGADGGFVEFTTEDPKQNLVVKVKPVLFNLICGLEILLGAKVRVVTPAVLENVLIDGGG